ncbi:MAG: hypothetical protein WC346_07480 [Methanogenium sp.]
MTPIKKILIAALIAYLCLAVWQVLSHPEISLQVLALSVFFIILTVITLIPDEERLKKAEMALLWISVGLFGLYAVLVAGGVV